MMKRWRKVWGMVLISVLVCAGCSHLPGKPKADTVPVDPSAVEDFTYLYRQNCAGCHGLDGTGGPATPVGNPVYLAIADDSVIRKVISEGVSGTTMPAFLEANGGMLTEKQIDVLVRGIREHGAKPGILAGANPPQYSRPERASSGDVARGRAVYATFCASCHGPNGKGGKGGQKGSSIVDGSYLALVSDQGLRTVVIVGRPDLGAPDWRNNLPGKPMSAEDVSDVVTWLASQRTKYPGQPYVISSLRERGNP
jgi:cytochrome c oxidase cbb3-type subunit III